VDFKGLAIKLYLSRKQKISTIFIRSKHVKGKSLISSRSNIFTSLEVLFTGSRVKIMSSRGPTSSLHLALPDSENSLSLIIPICLVSVESPQDFSWKPMTTSSIKKGILRKSHSY